MIRKYKIDGMHCVSCAMIIENGLEHTKLADEATCQYTNSELTVKSNKEINDAEILKEIKKLGYIATPSEFITQEISNAKVESEEKTALLKFGASALLSTPLVIFMLVSRNQYSELISLILATPIQFILGASFYRGLISNIRARMLGMDSLIAIGTSTAYFYSLYLFIFPAISLDGKMPALYFETSAFLITFVLLGKWLETKSKHKTSSALTKLIGLQVKTAQLVDGDQLIEVPVDKLKLGDIFLVKPGEKIATDGSVVSGNSFIDESMITGESMPISKTIGSKVIGATVNQSGALTVRVEKVGSETMLAQIITLVQEAQGSKAPIQDFADKVSAVFVPVVLAIATLTFVFWFVIIGSDFTSALNYFVAVVVISCPCALGLATPTALVTGIGLGAKNGIIIKGGQAIESSNLIDTVVFDKTGTITEGKPQVSTIATFNKTDERELLQLAASVERYSEHPLAKCVVEKAASQNIPFLDVTDFQAQTGFGATAKLATQSYYVGSQTYVQSKTGQPIPSFNVELSGTQVFLANQTAALGVIFIEDKIKESSKDAIGALKKIYEVYMITGDNSATAKKIASEVGITNVLAQILPGDKASEIKRLQELGKKVAMVGDGINDSPALTQADIGIAMGNGTDVSIESAGIVLLKNDLGDVLKALTIGKATLAKIKQNMFWALFYNLAGIPIAAGTFSWLGLTLRPEIAGLAMAFSSVSVVLNSLTLNKTTLNKALPLNKHL